LDWWPPELREHMSVWRRVVDGALSRQLWHTSCCCCWLRNPWWDPRMRQTLLTTSCSSLLSPYCYRHQQLKYRSMMPFPWSKISRGKTKSSSFRIRLPIS
jgi:hypothetical protein